MPPSLVNLKVLIYQQKRPKIIKNLKIEFYIGTDSIFRNNFNNFQLRDLHNKTSFIAQNTVLSEQFCAINNSYFGYKCTSDVS